MTKIKSAASEGLRISLTSTKQNRITPVSSSTCQRAGEMFPKSPELTALLSPEILPVGVFVNAPMETILSLVTDGTLKAVQPTDRSPKAIWKN